MAIEIMWTSSKKGHVQHAYDGAGKVLGFIQLQSSPLGPTFDVTQVTSKGNKRLGACGGGTLPNARARAREFLENIIKAEGGK